MNTLFRWRTLVVASSLTLLGAAQAQTGRAETLKPQPYFGIQAAYTLNAAQPFQLGLQSGFDRLIGPAGLRLVAGITLGPGGPSFNTQVNVLARFAVAERTQLYIGPGFTLRRENAAEGRLTYGPNVALGLEYSVAPNLWLGLEGQVDYRFNTGTGFNATPWRFGVSVVLRQRL